MGVLSLIRACRPPVTSITAIRLTLIPSQTQFPKIVTPALTSQLRQFVTSKSLSGGDDQKMMTITPSRYSWNKYKDMLHFYIMLGAIPGLLIVFLSNVFIGPAKLKPIPAGYVPKEHEYHRHPITRFMVKYFFTGHQEDYERNLFYVAESEEYRKMKILDRRVEELMAYRGDYPNYFVAPTIMGKYFRNNVEIMDKMILNRGEQFEDTSNPGDYWSSAPK